mgnify:CR=1 FL=1
MKEYLIKVAELQKYNTLWRNGQTHFNVLSDLYPEIAEKVRGTKIDPFHNDKVLPEFLSFVELEISKL